MANKKKVVATTEEAPITVAEETPSVDVVVKEPEVAEEKKEKTPVKAYETPEVTVNLEPVKRNPNVRVRFGKDYRGNIGGKAYNFKKGDVAVVPENVRRVLSKEEGLLRPL